MSKNNFDLAAIAGSVASNVGAAAASAASSLAQQGAKALSGEGHFFDETVTPERIKHLLDNIELGSTKAGISEKIEGMKYLLAMMARGKDVSEFYPDVVRNTIVKSVELKKLVYSYLTAYADANATCRELALLAINSFQRDLSDPNQLVRAMALRVLCNIRMREIVQIHLMSLKKCASDSSAYVRKTAAHSCGKIYQIDPDSKGEIVDVIEKLLGDKNTQVLSSAVAAFTEVCPDDLDLLHPHYRKICHLLADLDDWGQITTLNLLTRYIRKNFVKPEVVVKEEGDKKKKKKTGGKGKGGKGKGRKRDFYASDNSDSDSDSMTRLMVW